MKIDIYTDLPPWVNGIEYVANDHYIRLTDHDGNAILLWAKQIDRGECQKCHYTIYVEDRADIICPHCSLPLLWAWGEEQLCFIPDKESDFLKKK